MAEYFLTKMYAELLDLDDEITSFQADDDTEALIKAEALIKEDIRWNEDCGEFDGDVIGSFQKTEPKGWLVTYQFVGRPDQFDRYLLT